LYPMSSEPVIQSFLDSSLCTIDLFRRKSACQWAWMSDIYHLLNLLINSSVGNIVK